MHIHTRRSRTRWSWRYLAHLSLVKAHTEKGQLFAVTVYWIDVKDEQQFIFKEDSERQEDKSRPSYRGEKSGGLVQIAALKIASSPMKSCWVEQE